MLVCGYVQLVFGDPSGYSSKRRIKTDLVPLLANVSRSERVSIRRRIKTQRLGGQGGKRSGLRGYSNKRRIKTRFCVAYRAIPNGPSGHSIKRRIETQYTAPY